MNIFIGSKENPHILKSFTCFLLAILGTACQNVIGQNSKALTYPSITIVSASGTTITEAGSFSFTVGHSNNILILSEEGGVLEKDTLQDTTSTASVVPKTTLERIPEAEEVHENHENLAELELNISPNPFAERINLKIEEFEFRQKKDYRFELFDTAGNMLDSEQLETGEKEIILTNFPRGIYFLVLYSEGKLLKSFKLIKSNP
ncbi:T9SS type A sorting domain-containing protein [Pareuzebyella sediminis]|uniref:T9SS type A sorting domain-containing protein n=1 Tax=Pareuzebyella sediminis TaxID=2607998 RepID=UPI0011EC3A63|nr:T9SS type A sorting domain-containing protein [Pareuzebyella sediminis]